MTDVQREIGAHEEAIETVKDACGRGPVDIADAKQIR
jgi:hypothetical protein